jgi:hypothetical protein
MSFRVSQKHVISSVKRIEKDMLINSKFTIFATNEISTACVYSLNGMKIMDCITNGTNKVEVKTELSPGFYFITIQTMSGTIKSLEFVVE